jgi:peptidyl-prolyl cis-trans isomerase D
MAEALEYLTRGDICIATMQYSLLPSFLSLDRAKLGVDQNRALMHAITGYLRGMDPKKRPRFILFGESLGAQTMQDVFAKASAFAGKNTTKESFDKSVADEKLNKMQGMSIDALARQVSGLDNARSLVRWVYESKKGDVSKVIELNNKYVVACVTNIKEKGIATLDAVRKQVEAEAIKAKKAEKFLADINSKVGSATSIDQYASKLGLPIDTAKNMTFASPYVPKAGRELELIGTMSATANGKLVKPMKGENGVIIAQMISVTEATKIADYKQALNQVSQQLSSRVDYEMFEALKEKADIVDNRATFY